MASFTITYTPALDMPAESVEADSHEIDGDFVVFYDADGNATHRFRSSAVLSIKRTA